MADLDVDWVSLRVASVLLAQARERFAEAEELGEDLRLSCGHEGLAHAIGGFTAAWRVTRARLEERLTSLSEAMEAMADVFEDVEASLAERGRGGAEGHGL